jgi:radical SAM superfamily enzyme YgiQ (UPF0313 family)
MARVCLIRPLLSPTDFNGYPLNLLILAAALRAENHAVVICDFDFLKEVDASWRAPGFSRRAAAYVAQQTPDFIGITSMCSNYALALDLAQELKSLLPASHITFGGPHVSLCARRTVDLYHQVDTAVIGEGERTYCELIAALEQSRDIAVIPGIAYRSSTEVVQTCGRPLMPRLSDSPRPAYDLIDMGAYAVAAKGSYFEIYAGSGCPFKCSFCSTSIVWQRKYRTMDVSRIAEEINTLHAESGATAFNLIHDNLTSNKKFVRELAAEIRARCPSGIRWGFSSRIDTIDERTIRMVADAGCDYIFFGVESGSEKIQKSMGKKLKLSHLSRVVSQCLQNGIQPATSFILGFPNETHVDVAATISLAFKCRLAGVRRSFLNLLSPYTGTPVMEASAHALVYDATAVNTSMAEYLEPHHYEQIRADPVTFANYYALDYANSPFTAAEFRDMVDLFNVGLFKYRFLFGYLINGIALDPILIFQSLRGRLAALGIADRNHLSLQLGRSDIYRLLGPECADTAVELLRFDQALWSARTEHPNGLLVATRVNPMAAARMEPCAGCDDILRFLMWHSKGEVNVANIGDEAWRRYEERGIPCFRGLPAS